MSPSNSKKEDRAPIVIIISTVVLLSILAITMLKNDEDKPQMQSEHLPGDILESKNEIDKSAQDILKEFTKIGFLKSYDLEFCSFTVDPLKWELLGYSGQESFTHSTALYCWKNYDHEFPTSFIVDYDSKLPIAGYDPNNGFRIF